MEEKTPSHKLCVFLVRNYFFFNYVTTEGAISHNVLYQQQLSIARYKVIVCMLTITLRNYQKCPVPLTTGSFQSQHYSKEIFTCCLLQISLSLSIFFPDGYPYQSYIIPLRHHIYQERCFTCLNLYVITIFPRSGRRRS